jgi:pimeloyl-ACP methyl ester carboxylesterase
MKARNVNGWAVAASSLPARGLPEARASAASARCCKMLSQRRPRRIKHPKHFLFFRPSKTSQTAADAFLNRLNERKEDRDAAVTNETIHAQVAAITKWGMAAEGSLTAIKQPVLVVNGDNDIMVPTINSAKLAGKLPNAELSIFPDAGHGAIFQYHVEFIGQALRFLQQ